MIGRSRLPCLARYSLGVVLDAAEVDRHARLVADRPRVVARGDREEIAGSDLGFGAVVLHDLYPAWEDVAEMDRLAAIGSCDRLTCSVVAGRPSSLGTRRSARAPERTCSITAPRCGRSRSPNRRSRWFGVFSAGSSSGVTRSCCAPPRRTCRSTTTASTPWSRRSCCAPWTISPARCANCGACCDRADGGCSSSMCARTTRGLRAFRTG